MSYPNLLGLKGFVSIPFESLVVFALLIIFSCCSMYALVLLVLQQVGYLVVLVSSALLGLQALSLVVVEVIGGLLPVGA